MSTLNEAVADFLAQKRIAVAGVSRSENGGPGNLVYQKLRDAGYEVFAVNPNAEEVEGDRCYPNLRAIPDGVEGVVIATTPQVTDEIVRECAQLGVPRVWIHRSFGQGSVSDKAVEFCRERSITVIPGACPMMYCDPVDFGHKCMRWVLGFAGGLPEDVY